MSADQDTREPFGTPERAAQPPEAEYGYRERSPEEIQDEIERTRQEMGDTIEALQHKLAPDQMMQQIWDYVRSGGGEYMSSLGNTARNNPVPLALIGLGLAWMAASSMRSRSSHEYDYERLSEPGEGEVYAVRSTTVYEGVEPTGTSTYGATAPGAGQPAAGMGGTSAGRRAIHRGAETTRHAGESTYDKARSTASDLAHRASSSLDSMRQRMSRMTSGSRHTQSSAYQQASHQMRRAREGFGEMLSEQPLLVGAMAIAAGAAIGGLLPRTRREDRLMGQKSDELVHQAQEVGREQYQEVKEAARHVAETTTEAAREGIREAVDTARDTASEEAHKRGWTADETSGAAKGAESRSGTSSGVTSGATPSPGTSQAGEQSTQGRSGAQGGGDQGPDKNRTARMANPVGAAGKSAGSPTPGSGKGKGGT